MTFLMPPARTPCFGKSCWMSCLAFASSTRPALSSSARMAAACAELTASDEYTSRLAAKILAQMGIPALVDREQPLSRQIRALLLSVHDTAEDRVGYAGALGGKRWMPGGERVAEKTRVSYDHE